MYNEPKIDNKNIKTEMPRPFKKARLKYIKRNDIIKKVFTFSGKG